MDLVGGSIFSPAAGGNTLFLFGFVSRTEKRDPFGKSPSREAPGPRQALTFSQSRAVIPKRPSSRSAGLTQQIDREGDKPSERLTEFSDLPIFVNFQITEGCFL